MSKVRVLVGTKKGAFILTADGKRKKWKVSGPHFAGWEIYHVKGSPADPNRIYASQTSGWFGQIIQRSDDGGKTWNTPGSSPEELKGPEGMPKGESNKFVYEGEVGTHKWYDGTQHPWEFKRVWHIEPSLTDPDTAYAGVEDAAIFKTTDGGKTWKELPGLRNAKGNLWQPGAGGMAVHTILLDPKNAKRIYVAISAGGCFRTDDGGKTWKPINARTEIPIRIARPGRGSRPLRSSHRPASVAPGRVVHAKALGRVAHRQRRRAMDGRSAAICRRISVFRLTFTRTSRKRFTSCPSRAIRSIIRRTANCACIAARPAATNGSRSRKACRRRIAT